MKAAALQQRIDAAEAELVERRAALRRRFDGTRRRATGYAKAWLPRFALTAGSTLLAGLLFTARRPRVLASPRSNARAAAIVAPLALRFFTPTLGREWATLIASVVVPFAFAKGPPAPQTAPMVRLSSYAGRWFELARLSSPFEFGCARNATATYLPQPDGRLQVVNRCETRRGRARQAQGVARVVHGSGNSKLRLSFAPRLLRWLPFAWADYWILDVLPDYSAAIVGTPRRDGLWLLARSPSLAPEATERLLARAAAQGYDIAALKYTLQTGA